MYDWIKFEPKASGEPMAIPKRRRGNPLLKIIPSLLIPLVSLFIPSDLGTGTLPQQIPAAIHRHGFFDLNPKTNFNPSRYVQALIEHRAESIMSIPSHRQYFEKVLSKLSRAKDTLESTRYEDNFVMAHSAVECMGEFDARSPTGPVGIVQLAKATAMERGVPINSYYDGRKNPEDALEGYDRHMELIANLPGVGNSLEKALAAYHNGLGYYDRSGIGDLEGHALFDAIDPRVQWYIIEVGAVKRLLDRFELVYEQQPLLTEKISKRKRPVKRGETIYAIGRKEGIPPREILDVNRGLNQNKVPVGYLLRMPKTD
jgi:hypothetical protein